MDPKKLCHIQKFGTHQPFYSPTIYHKLEEGWSFITGYKVSPLLGKSDKMVPWNFFPGDWFWDDPNITLLLLLLFLKRFIYLRERVNKHMCTSRRRETEAESVPSAKPNTGLNPTTLRQWSEPKPIAGCSTDWAI